MVCPRCGRKSSGKICVWCRSGRNLSEYSIKDYDKYSAEIPEEDYRRELEEKIREEQERAKNGILDPILENQEHRENREDREDRENRGNEENRKNESRENGEEEMKEAQSGRGRSRKKATTTQKRSWRNADADRSERKEKKQKERQREKQKEKKDKRIRAMQSELEDLRARQQEHEDLERERKRQEKEQSRQDKFQEKAQSHQERAKEKIKPSVLAVVGFSRLLQLASAVLMALLTVMSVFSFWQHREGLGGIMTILDERNYALALYLASAGAVVFFGMIWTLWIMSRKGAGGEVRMKTYDTGRGFLPFLLCLGAVCVVTRLSGLVPEDGEMWHGMAKAVSAIVIAVQEESRQLMLVSTAGVIFSLIRKILHV